MADERPLNLVQWVADYFDDGTLKETLYINHFVETFDYYYGDSEIVSYHNVIFYLTVARQNYCL
ncbi:MULTISPECIES: hypothetical protein [Lactiplantibacillus]|uniref:hypothetical protein n=1 Tax=Lactiplantibacillus TaxID=2767842 RepID=UPI00128B23A1|nr:MULTISPECIES: hypothetical protein [Lactiplantibacillus]MBU5276986.1 hypothetical protein [Lactiplantibacillus argentoratensis]MCB7464550.1 hypothetical protein [Lactiplantibacillus argentoratensis]MPQ36488.1 hypothetical protein [Lactiplantibacillus plantarum]MZU93114.1 hypothetical protein [Lactiplantibacillus plantarum]